MGWYHLLFIFRMLERLLLTGVCVMVFIFNHSISSVQSWLDLNLPREHVPYFFTNNPHIRSWCLEDSACPYKVELRLLKNTIIMSKYVFIFRITNKCSPMKENNNVSVCFSVNFLGVKWKYYEHSFYKRDKSNTNPECFTVAKTFSNIINYVIS